MTILRFHTPLIETDLWGTWVGNHPGLPAPLFVSPSGCGAVARDPV